MDPISAAIIAAIAAGIGKVGEGAISDAYAFLKGKLAEKFGSESELARAVEGVEKRPDSEARKGTLAEEVEHADAASDPELVAAAEKLLKLVEQQPGGRRIVQTAIGQNIAQAADHSKAEVTVNRPPTSR